jgi:hypothetical protein|tara:strand:- start:1928 stop:2779 length:852 start_codon:yes stop_codon:yes gene_type:complete
MKTLRTLSKEYYGDSTRWFIGTVVNSTPPYGLEGRVKVRISGVHSPNTSDIPESDLPWASVVIPTTEAGVSGLGRTPKLTAGALVFGFFMDGVSSQIPIIIGSLPNDEYPTNVQLNDKIENDQSSQVETLQSDEITNTSDKVSRRRSEGMKFFIDNGYTINQAAGIVGNLDHISRFVTSDGGIANWNETRKSELINFSNRFLRAGGNSQDLSERYIIQLRFVLYELRGSKVNANGKLLRSSRVEGEKGSALIIKRYYIDNYDSIENENVLKQCVLAKVEIEQS